ncbi:MAG: enoyl-CoA hydratase/isomerase family protein [Burkholderiales bacterium]|nr:enoyl-CoA hydratase/isomerase family protein [Burkholderiales bacterium]
MSSFPLRFERDGDVALIVFDNPARMNPLSVDFQQGLRELLERVRNDRTLRALVLTGEGRGFCVGADLTSMKPTPDDPRTLGERTAENMHALSNRLIQELHELPVPVVSAVNGACAGAGVGVALAADVVLAARSAYFYLPFLPKLGIVPDLGSTWFMQRLAGRGRALGLALLGDRLSAEQAVQWGVAWACVDDDALRAEALAIAQRLAKLPAHATLEARRAFDAAASNTLVQQLHYEAERQRELLNKPSFMQGVRAFLEKRDPRFD